MRIRGVSRGDWGRRVVKLAAILWRLLMVRTTFVAITGSVGKTTGKELIAAMLATRGRTLATHGTQNEAMAVANTILQVRPWHRFAVIEVGTDAPGWIRRSTSLVRPDVAVVLNVKRTHTTHFETLHDTAREKACLPAGLRRGGIAIMNLDDALVSKMPVPGGCRIVRFGEDPSADVRACGASAVWPDRLALDITAGGETAHFQTQLVGTHWTTSVLAATAAALACGVTLQQAARVAGKVSPFHGRMQPEALPCGAIVLRDDFNSSIDTFYPALRVLREARAARKILVITTMSDSGESWSQRLLRIGTETMGWVDQLVLVGEEKHVGKTERRMAGIAYPSERLHCLGSQRAAAELLREMLRAGDLVLLRGLSSDHVGRVFHALQGPVNCWAEYCPRMILCEDCPELHGAPPALIRIRSTASGD